MTFFFVEPPDRARIKRVWVVVSEDRVQGDGALLVRPGESLHGVAYDALTPGEWHGPTPMTYIGP